MTRYIFITGGVVSSLGKGLLSASLGSLLQSRGYKVRLRKLDPYLNVDPGTMSPIQHGEVYVTDDGAETDLDLGHYERFTGISSRKSDNITSGKIYHQILSKERRGDFLGGTVQVIPHVTDAIKNFITADLTDDTDFVLCEIGGTVGDIEALPFFEAIRQLGNDLGKSRAVFVHLTLIPYLAAAKELKTKPTQHSVKELRSIGIAPDIVVCRCDREIPDDKRKKISLFCNVPLEAVIPALDAPTMYHVPERYHAQGLDEQILKSFGLNPAKTKADVTKWQDLACRVTGRSRRVRIALVGKYIELKDAYKSVVEALDHGGIANDTHVKIDWFDADDLLKSDTRKYLGQAAGILVPGGFGARGAEGKMAAAQFAREYSIPYFGICLGMQLACIEAVRNVAKLTTAGSSEFGACKDPIVGLMTEWHKQGQKLTRSIKDDLGGTMRLGAYDARLIEGTRAHSIYGTDSISERHRHRYEVNIKYQAALKDAGLIISGMSPDGQLPEIVERTDHPWFVGVQFHPELKSRPFAPHPLFTSFIRASLEYTHKGGSLWYAIPHM